MSAIWYYPCTRGALHAHVVMLSGAKESRGDLVKGIQEIPPAAAQ